jgi:hypothetical protein
LELNINEAKLMLDKANYNITGKLNFSPENTLKQLEIVADKVNFDNYLPAPDAELSVREQINTDFQKLAVLKDKNWKVKFKADSANIRGIPYTGFGFQANTQNKVLHLIDLWLMMYSAQKYASVPTLAISDLPNRHLKLLNTIFPQKISRQF